MNRFWILGVALALGGCGLPPAIQVASYVVDGVSYLATDKSVTDHILSAAVEQDCALIRALDEGREICGEDAPLLADLEKSPDAGEAIALQTTPTGFGATESDLHETWSDPAFDVAEQPANWAPTRIRTQVGREPATNIGRYFVLGSFRQHAAAERAAQLYAPAGSLVVAEAVVKGQIWHRVVSGPYPVAQLTEVRNRLAEAGIKNFWQINLCQADLAAPPCTALPLSLPPIPAAPTVIAERT